MIYLEKGQFVAENDDLVVCDLTDTYLDTDMVLCAKKDTPDEPYCKFEAKFIAYGGVVYAVSDEEKLLEEVKKNDPDTLLSVNTTTASENVLTSSDIKVEDNSSVKTTEQSIEY